MGKQKIKGKIYIQLLSFKEEINDCNQNNFTVQIVQVQKGLKIILTDGCILAGLGCLPILKRNKLLIIYLKHLCS